MLTVIDHGDYSLEVIDTDEMKHTGHKNGEYMVGAELREDLFIVLEVPEDKSDTTWANIFQSTGELTSGDFDSNGDQIQDGLPFFTRVSVTQGDLLKILGFIDQVQAIVFDPSNAPVGQ
jgi:hypothetical protein